MTDWRDIKEKANLWWGFTKSWKYFDKHIPMIKAFFASNIHFANVDCLHFAEDDKVWKNGNIVCWVWSRKGFWFSSLFYVKKHVNFSPQILKSKYSSQKIPKCVTNNITMIYDLPYSRLKTRKYFTRNMWN